MGSYSEFRFYSPMLDTEAVRVSLTDSRNQEFFAIVPDDGTSRQFRDRRNQAIENIETAIHLGLDPGEVRSA